MTDHKFTDDEIIKALEICAKSKCWGDCKDMVCPAAKKQGCYFYLRTDEDYEGVIQDEMLKDALALINRQKAQIEKLEKLDELAERNIEASTAVINDLRSEVALLNDANTNLQDLYQAEKSKVLKKQEKLIMAYRKLQTAKSEAIKEFAEKMKGVIPNIDDTYIERIVEDYIDNLVKEMTEESK